MTIATKSEKIAVILVTLIAIAIVITVSVSIVVSINDFINTPVYFTVTGTVNNDHGTKVYTDHNGTYSYFFIEVAPSWMPDAYPSRTFFTTGHRYQFYQCNSTITDLDNGAVSQWRLLE